MRISDWSSDVCSSDLPAAKPAPFELPPVDAKYSTTPSNVDRSKGVPKVDTFPNLDFPDLQHATLANGSKLILAERHEIPVVRRSEEHTSELQSLMRISYAVFCLKKKKNNTNIH